MGIRTRLWPGLTTREIWLDALLALSSAVAISLTRRAPGEAGSLPVSVAAAGTVLLAILLLVLRRRAPLVPFAVSVVLTALSPAVTVAVLITAYAVGRYESRWPIRVGAGVVGSLAVLQPWAVDTLDETAGAVTAALLVVVLPGAIGAWVRARADLMVALTERAERAEAERELLAREAIATERARIAREMHDAVGHRVSLMVLQAGAIEMAATDRERVEQLACQVQVAGRQALDELRQAVGVLRDGDDDGAPLGPQPGLDDIERMVKECRAAGMDVEMSRPVDAAPVDPMVCRAAYRIAQEALTNAGKHAPGAHVGVAIERPAGKLVVRVVNGPAAEPVHASAGGGFGLVGLRERVRTLNGTLRAEPRLDGGFVVEAVLPA
jgi:signal transduction histidine kinase